MERILAFIAIAIGKMQVTAGHDSIYGTARASSTRRDEAW